MTGDVGNVRSNPQGDKRGDRLTLALVRRRVADVSYSQYLGLHNLLKGITIGVAVITLTRLASGPDARLGSLALWAASCALVLVNHATTARGILLLTPGSAALDSVFPLVLALAECALLFLAGPLPATGERASSLWFLAVAIHGLLVMALVTTVSRRLAPHATDPGITPLVLRFVEWMRFDRRGSGFMAAVALVMGVASYRWAGPGTPNQEWFDVIAGGLLTLGLMPVIVMASRQRLQIIDYVEHAVAHPTDPAPRPPDDARMTGVGLRAGGAPKGARATRPRRPRNSGA